MHSATVAERLAVCSWSLQPTDPHDLVAKLQAIGLALVQLNLEPLRASPTVWGDTGNLLRKHGITVVSGMCLCVGEDYSTLESIRRTGGVAPDATWAENVEHFKAYTVLAQQLGLKLVSFHAGFVPHEELDPAFLKMAQRLAVVADIFGERNICVCLETGQETAAELVHLLQKLAHPNVGVNFDPANMLLYDKGDPVDALRVLGPFIRQVHIKDARRTKVPGTWGEEVVAGTGEVDWRAFFATLKQVAPSVNLAIEREAGSQRVADIRAARTMMENLFPNA
ncbi:MAG: 3-dehydroshikimate dehydratase [Verrucomicrobiota bacterium]|jgi:sugar phosphate isomerase/epimerase